MKKLLFVLMLCLASSAWAKEKSPLELEIVSLQKQLKEKQATLKEQKKVDQLAKAKAAVEKANAKLAKLQATN